MTTFKSPGNTKFDTNRYEVITQAGENGDVILPIPPELMERMGWNPGDQIDFEKDSQGRIIMRKVG